MSDQEKQHLDGEDGPTGDQVQDQASSKSPPKEPASEHHGNEDDDDSYLGLACHGCEDRWAPVYMIDHEPFDEDDVVRDTRYGFNLVGKIIRKERGCLCHYVYKLAPRDGASDEEKQRWDDELLSFWYVGCDLKKYETEQESEEETGEEPDNETDEESEAD
ncbi:hypothetical protein BDY21DRAFT_360388 [Lineolata rhizophorae]|uniref:Uncharacterized protein n=1 Tax=Lineolata rhizophorae TaxID=578093 RepID=A0A6A6PBD8_9PEZI|nr:hypothetical protein BDY21DRAFT_360388 [Lineolata rhizophorae]